MSIDMLPSCSSIFYENADKSVHHSATKRIISNKSGNKYEATFVQNTVALAVISKLHKWACQLFWITIICVIGCYGESKQKTFQDLRRNVLSSNNRRCKSLTDLEMQLLRHLTSCPQTSIHRPLRTSSHKKRHQLSRMPSPNLFDIREVEEPVE